MPSTDQALDNIIILRLLSSFLIGYILGSIPFGVIFTRLAGLGDIRAIGSGNIGATNVLRTGRKDIAALTLLSDMLKGTLAIYLAAYLFSAGQIKYDNTIALPPLFAAMGAFIGHLFPVWLKFKGGKGVATFLGITLGLSVVAALSFAIVWLAVAYVTRYSSLSAFAASFSTSIVFWLTGNAHAGVVFFFFFLLLLFKHKDNIHRLLRGEESKIELNL